MSKNLIILFLGFMVFEFLLPNGFSMVENRSNNKEMTQDEYQRALTMQGEIHGLIRSASKYEKMGQHELALENYLKAYEINQCASLVAVCRGALADNYEALGEYKAALEHVEWFLEGLNPKEPLFEGMLKTKIRLLKKIEEQKKSGGSVAKTYQRVMSSGQEEQKRFLESMQTKGVATYFKQASLQELDGKFAEAREVYEKLLLKRETIAQEMNLENWVMLYPAIQRTSELIGDEKREKEALVWIKANILDSQGQFHQSLARLAPEVVDHLNKQIKKYQL